MIVLKYTKVLPAVEGKDELPTKVWFEVVEDIDADGNPLENYKQVCERLEKDVRNDEQDYSKVEIIEAGFILHKSSLRARQKQEENGKTE